MHRTPSCEFVARRRWAWLSACILASAGWAALAAPPARVHTVVMDGTQFAPARLEVQVGDTVVWKNQDPFPHTATANDKTFDSGDIASGQSWKYRAKTKGTYPYVCTLHSTMKGVLVVK